MYIFKFILEESSMGNFNNGEETGVFGLENNETLIGNTGKIITVFTESGGCSGRGFTGLLVEANCRFIKLITSLPSAPRHPFGRRRGDFDDFGFGGCCGGGDRECSRFGTAIIIPIRHIVSFVFNEI
jgi:hypothetical protein